MSPRKPRSPRCRRQPLMRDRARRRPSNAASVGPAQDPAAAVTQGRSDVPPDLLTDAFFDSFETSLGDLDTAQTLPPACYTDAAFYEFEKEALFDHEWLCVGREDWVKEPGDYFTTHVVGEPIVVARARDGVVRAMSSVCQHRAMLVAEGKGNARGFMCPYHHWVYGLDGRLVNAPAMERTCGFDKASVRLPE